MSSSELFPVPAKALLQSLFCGKSLQEIPVPSAILDVAKIKKNSEQMLEAVKELEVSFRAHVKTHKTTELTQLQVGTHSKDVRLIVSTIVEAESASDLLLDYRDAGAKISLLYGLPLGASHVARLANVATKLGPGSVAVLIDNPAQLESVRKFKHITGFAVNVFIKTDSGYHRAGVLPESSNMIDLLKQISAAEQEADLVLLGFYSHNSLSYGGNSPNEAMDNLKVEIDACRQASTHLTASLATRTTPLIISVGASPSALSIQNIQASSSFTSQKTANSESAKALRDALELTTSNFELEIHAGVYPVFDIQQVAASSREFESAEDAHNAIALSILAEVVSLYPDRTSTPEVLVNAGCLALAREPCKDYSGWGVLSSWNIAPELYNNSAAVDPASRIIVGRISQEHGILGWEDQSNKKELPLVYGQKVRIWPNHACITSAGFGWYLIVDSDSEDKGEEVIDVWPRWRGW